MVFHALRGRRWLAALLILALVLPAGVAGQARRAPASVDPAVLRQTANSAQATFWVLLRARADLAPAAGQGWSQRGSAVISRLQATARASQAALLPTLRAQGATFRSFWIANALQVTAGRATLDALAAMPEVAKIVADQPRRIPPPRDRQLAEPAAGVEWNVERIRAPEVWSAFNTRGEGIVVASIDTGVQFDHPALVEQYRGNLGGGVFDHNYSWVDTVGTCQQPVPCDPIYHGTHTMGTIVGDDGQAGANQIGVAPGARWISAKACDIDGCPLAALLAAGEWMLAPTDLSGQNPRPDLRPQIVNNSWGGLPGDDFFLALVEAWQAAGIFPVFSAGNSGPLCATAGSPGDYDAAYAVGAFDVDNQIAYFSSRGPGALGGVSIVKPNIAAPGVDVRSSIPGGEYALGSGTSMAAPHVAGTVALLWSLAPALVGDIAATRAVLDQSAVDVDDSSCDAYPAAIADNLRNNVWGEGRLDAFAAAERAPHGPTGVISGTVGDDSSGAPVAGARVRVSGPYERTVMTDASGMFSLRLPVGTYVLSAEAFGYVGHAIANTPVAADETTLLAIALQPLPTYALSGQVRDTDGRPLPNVQVALSGTPLAAATSDSEGFYRFARVPAGAYTLAAQPSGCNEPRQDQITIAADLTHDIALAPHTDGYGYGCASAPADYLAASTPLPIPDYEYMAILPLPFPFTFYGQTYGTAFVAGNGSLNFLDPYTYSAPSSIPNSLPPNAAIYPFWEYIYLDSQAGVYTELIGEAPDRKLVIEWRDALLCCETDERVTFEVVLGEQGQITMQYADLGESARSHGGNATIGIEDERGTTALQYASSKPLLDTRLAVRYTLPPSGFVGGVVTDGNDGLPVASATVRAYDGARLAREVSANAQGAYQLQLPLGSYTIEASSPHYSTAALSATVEAENQHLALDLQLQTARGEVAPQALARVVPAGQQRTLALTIQNTGASELDWQLLESGYTPTALPARQAHSLGRLAQPPSWGPPELPAGLAAVGRATAAQDGLETVIDDPAGDAQGQVDITTVRSGAPDGSAMTLALDFAADTPMQQVAGYVMLDTDQNPDTGFPATLFSGRAEQDIGVDYYASLFSLSAADPYVLIASVSGDVVAAVPATIMSNTVTFSTPLAALADDGMIDVALVVGDSVGPTDWAPDAGHGTLTPFTDIAWLSASATSGTLAPGASQTLEMTLDASQLAGGIYDAALTLQSNSGRQPLLRVPVHMEVPAYRQAVNLGGADYRDQEGELWAADRVYSPGGWGYIDQGRLVRTRSPIAGTADDPLYQVARSGQLEYRFDGLPAGEYELELRFAEIEGKARGRRLFDVIVAGQLALPAHDIAGEVGLLAADDHLLRVAVRGGQLSIRFVPRANYGLPLIGAIRLTHRADQ